MDPDSGCRISDFDLKTLTLTSFLKVRSSSTGFIMTIDKTIRTFVRFLNWIFEVYHQGIQMLKETFKICLHNFTQKLAKNAKKVTSWKREYKESDILSVI